MVRHLNIVFPELTPVIKGLIPQAPIHTQSLVVLGIRPKSSGTASKEKSALSTTRSGSVTPTPYTVTEGKDDAQPQCRTIGEMDRTNPEVGDRTPPIGDEECHGLLTEEVPIAVVEQRVSNLAQGALSLILLTSPFLHLLHLIPRGVLAGLL
jgi:hypothetical protein